MGELLQRGVRSENVSKMQLRLNQLCYDCYNVGGGVGTDVFWTFGQQTEYAVKWFQQRNGLTVDGKVEVDGATWTKMFTNSPWPTQGVDYYPWSSSAVPTYYPQGSPAPWRLHPYDATNTAEIETLNITGCGPTCCAMAISVLKAKAVLPPTIADYSTNNGYRDNNGVAGTSWNLFPNACREYGISCGSLISTWNESDITAHCNAGKPVVINVKGGVFTDNGHYVIIYKISSGTVYTRDPASRNIPSVTVAVMKDQCKGYMKIG